MTLFMGHVLSGPPVLSCDSVREAVHTLRVRNQAKVSATKLIKPLVFWYNFDVCRNVPKAPVDIVSFAFNLSDNLLHAPIMYRFMRIIEIGNQDHMVDKEFWFDSHICNDP
jgi:hypothetical protein